MLVLLMRLGMNPRRTSTSGNASPVKAVEASVVLYLVTSRPDSSAGYEHFVSAQVFSMFFGVRVSLDGMLTWVLSFVATDCPGMSLCL